jgi:SAM-dependent methyltransferase
MTETVIDVRTVRQQQRATWDHVSAGWQRWQPEFERGAAAVTARLLALAGIEPGQSVLDIGSGIGEPALPAARTVGDQGRVVGIDLSAVMIGAARAAATAAALDNVEFLIGDLETAQLPPRSFDAALSRWALMFAADRVALLRTIAALLKPGGVLAAAVWGPPEQVPMLSLAFRAVSAYLELPPPPPGPGPFSMSDPHVLQEELDQAGFPEVEIIDLEVGFGFDSVEDFVRFSRDVLPPGMKQLIGQRCGSLEDAGVWQAVRSAARQYQRADATVSLPSLSRCVRAVAGGRP